MSEADAVEDTVSFLEKARSVYPDVTHLLTKVQLLALDMSHRESFTQGLENEEFAKLTDAYFTAKLNCDMVKTELRSALLGPRTAGKPVDVIRKGRIVACLEMVQKRIKTIWDSKLSVTESSRGEVGLPRTVRLCRRLKLSEKETTVMTYVLCAQVAEAGPVRYSSSYMYRNDILYICRLCEMSISEMVEFLAPDRTHMQQGIFPDVQQSYLLQSQLAFDEVSCKVLIGAPLKQNEFLKIDQTCFAEVISEEAGNEHLKQESPLSKKPGQGEGEKSVTFAGETEDSSKEEGEGTLEVVGEGVKADGEKEEGDKGKKEDEIMDLDELLRRERQMEEERKASATTETQLEETGDDVSSDELTPYKTDLQYLDDHFQLIAQKLKVKSMESRLEMEAQYDNEMNDARSLRQKREAMGKFKVLEKKCEKRLAMTREAGSWLPRLERMATSRGLCQFEKNILLTLIGFIIQPTKINPGFDSYHSMGEFSVGELLRIFCGNLHDQIKHRIYFYKSSPMVREGMLIVHNSGLTGDQTNTKVEIDRRMLDFCVGLDTEFSEIVEGSHLYFPQTKFEQVILGSEQKNLILSTVSNFEAYKRCRRKMGLDDAITYGAGMVLLFYGSPGTGKTMMANALANKLQKKVLLINFPSLGSMTADENFKFIFREAKINDAILFFDECEAIFETREKGTHNVNMLLTEIERHDGLIIMATNRPFDLDEAMHRRIMIAIEFRQPDHLLRKAIWESHIPEQMKLADDVNLDELSLRYELSGGFIKNAILSALSIAVSRDGENPVVCHKDLQQGANLQLRGSLRMKDFHRRVLPTSGLDRVVVEEKLMKTLREIVQFEKARSILFGQWGFGVSEEQGITVLLHGVPGTGKSLAAQAIGYEVGRPLKVVNCGELLSKWVGESTKNIDAIFEESRNSDAILVFDEAEGLFGTRTAMGTSTDRYANVDVGVLLYHIERFPGIIILTTNLIENIDKAFFRRLRFVLHFETPPTDLRAKLWKILIPQETPVADDVDFDRLSRHEMTGGNIKSSIFRAACRAALRAKEKRQVTQQDLMDAAEEEVGKESTRTSFRRQDSATNSMYN